MDDSNKFHDDDKTRIGFSLNDPKTVSPGKPSGSTSSFFDEDKTRIGPSIQSNQSFEHDSTPPFSSGQTDPLDENKDQESNFTTGIGLSEQIPPPFTPPGQDNDKTQIRLDPPSESAIPREPQQAQPSQSSAPQQAWQRQSFVSEDDMWFVLEGQTGMSEVPLNSGIPVTVGRDESQDVVVDEPTLSRCHLVLQRDGDKVAIQVLGLNGLVMNGETHKSKTIEVPPPVSFTIGKVTCRVNLKVDTDATIMMTDPARQNAPLPHNPSSLNKQFNAPAFAKPKPVAPFNSNNNSAFQTSPSFPGSHTESNKPTFPFPNFDSSDEGNFSTNQPAQPNFYSGNPNLGFDDFGGQSSWDPAATTQESFPGTPNTKNKMFFIAGGVVLLIVILAGVSYWLLGSSEQDPQIPQTVIRPLASETLPPLEREKAPLPTQVDKTPETKSFSAQDPSQYNLHAKLFDRAYEFYNSGNNSMACDYLHDIPVSSAYRERAFNLAKKLGNCTLNE